MSWTQQAREASLESDKKYGTSIIPIVVELLCANFLTLGDSKLMAGNGVSVESD